MNGRPKMARDPKTLATEMTNHAVDMLSQDGFMYWAWGRFFYDIHRSVQDAERERQE
jgi:hypothetical protein